MAIIKIPKKINLKEYDKDIVNPQAFYGLPKEIIFCKKCAMSNQKPITSIEFKSDPTLV